MSDLATIETMCFDAAVDVSRLGAAVAQCDPVIAALTVFSLTGRLDALNAMKSSIKGGWSFEQSVPPNIAEATRHELVQTVLAIAEGADPTAR